MEKKLFTKDFTLVVIGQIISLFGNGILRFALPLYLLRETGSATLFGIVTACSFLPVIVLSFLGGILADRANKRNIMVILDFLTAAIIFTLLMVLGKLSIVPLFITVLMLLYGISGVYQPAVQAAIPALVSGENILAAGAIVNQVQALAGLLGPIIGGVLFGAFGIVPILIVGILCFFLSAVMEIFIYIPFEKRKDTVGIIAIVKNDIKESKNYIKNKKPILIKIIWLVALFNFVLTSMLIVGTPILVIDTLGMSDVQLGITQGALALGGLCGGLLTAAFHKKMRLSNAHNLLLICSLLVGVMAMPLLFSMSSEVSYITLTLGSFAMMIFATMFSIQMLATVQTETPQELVGKVVALMMSISMCAQPLGQAIYGIAFDILKKQTGAILLFAALCAVGISLFAGRVFRSIREEERTVPLI